MSRPRYLVHERQRLLCVFLFLFGQILQHLLHLLLIVLHLGVNTCRRRNGNTLSRLRLAGGGTPVARLGTNRTAGQRRAVCSWTAGGSSSERGLLHFRSRLQGKKRHADGHQTPAPASKNGHGGGKLTWRDVQAVQQANFLVQVFTVQSVWVGDRRR